MWLAELGLIVQKERQWMVTLPDVIPMIDDHEYNQLMKTLISSYEK